MTQHNENAAARQRARAKAAAAANAPVGPKPVTTVAASADKPVKLSNGNEEKCNNGVAMTSEMVTLLQPQVSSPGISAVAEQAEMIEKAGQNVSDALV